jgi:hypothetical protein
MMTKMEAGRRREFIPAKDSADVGYLFIGPGQTDRVQYGVMTSSDLVDVAHQYFGARGGARANPRP